MSLQHAWSMVSRACALLAYSCLLAAADGDSTNTAQADEPLVRWQRVPDGGLQPQVAVGADGAVHLVYYRGDPKQGDLFYVRSVDGGRRFSAPLQVNRHAGSAIAVGNIRGAQLALGRQDRVHVAWNGSSAAQPRATGGGSPMLYTRMNDAGNAFETERNLIQEQPGLDGGGSVAADRAGHVVVVWHAPTTGMPGEANRRVWLAASHDDGLTFATERAASPDPTGACGCCGLRAFVDQQGRIYILYRSANQTINRDMYLLSSDLLDSTWHSRRIAEWKVGQCIMSASAFAAVGQDVWGTWETEGQVFYGLVSGSKAPRAIAAPGVGGNRKYSTLAANDAGQMLLAWTEGMGWNRGGSVCWQMFDAAGRPIVGGDGRAPGVPTRSLVAAFPCPDGGFVVLY